MGSHMRGISESLGFSQRNKKRVFRESIKIPPHTLYIYVYIIISKPTPEKTALSDQRTCQVEILLLFYFFPLAASTLDGMQVRNSSGMWGRNFKFNTEDVNQTFLL